ncbi:hypothetical protein POM88_047699 [Heracleum sosnowskyi]|uniref:DUF4220 domain-containing protein n=1 Tax=Heracleum sosnowskyi TaxID=360622 RepID=A0AAD8GTY7_9APIA|nr:hypothetical protein POM88_047699 [Heracleum sosnowskyi]
MRGAFNGLQALFLRDCPYAYYVHCFAHRLQLALVGAAEKQDYVWEFFSMLANVVNIVSGSSKRLSELQTAHGIEVDHSVASGERETGRGLNQIGNLQRAGSTRWSSHFNSVCSLIDKYGSIIVVLESINNCTTNSSAQRGEARVGLIASKQADYSNILHTFWAPFLLAHLGGPDPITAFALEDNELWLRHLFSLFTQCIPVAYVFYQSLTPNKLLIPSLLMFLCGIIKYAERTYALYCSSTKTFRDSILNEPAGKLALPVDGKNGNMRNATDLKPLEVVKHAFFCFSNFKGLVVDLIFSFPAHSESSKFFLERSWNDAFRVVEVELNFLYDVLFTKLTVVDHPVGFGCRAVSVSAIVTSLVLFHYVDKKNLEPEGFEVEITYILLIGGIVLEVIAFFMLVFSDWTVVKLERLLNENPNEQSWKRMFMDFIVNVNVRKGEIICWLLNIGGVREIHTVSETTDSRWAESISGYNFIYYCVHRRSIAKEKIYDLIGIRAFLDEMVYVQQYRLPSYVKEFIFKELKTKSETVYDRDTAKRICSAKGDWVLETEGYKGSYLFELVKDLEYDESLLLWHIATELCYNDETDIIFYSPEHNRKIAKLISDYMIYLLVVKPGMMSAVSRKVIISFRETCDEAKDIFDEILTEEKFLPEVVLQKIACDRFMDSATKKTRHTSILFNAADLATELKRLEFNERWKITSKVWASHIKSYGASHIKSNAHAQQLSKGGEFITVVWLLMTHLCLVDQFEGPPKFGSPPRILNLEKEGKLII